VSQRREDRPVENEIVVCAEPEKMLVEIYQDAEQVDEEAEKS
jgi:hypothetical protein